jgi:hypothetical protein
MTRFEVTSTQSILSHDFTSIIERFDILYSPFEQLFVIPDSNLDSFNSYIDSLTDKNFTIEFFN